MYVMSIYPSDPESAQAAGGKDRGKRAWDGDPPQAAAARQRLLEATARCIARDGITSATVAAIASEAGVSRQTVYRYFSGRGELTGGAILAAAEGLRTAIALQLRDLTDPADMIVEAAVLGLTETRRDPVLRAIADSAHLDGSVASRLTEPGGLEWMREILAPAIEAAGWNESDADAAMELILRLYISFVICPAPERDAGELRAFLYRYLIPGLGLAVSEEI